MRIRARDNKYDYGYTLVVGNHSDKWDAIAVICSRHGFGLLEAVEQERCGAGQVEYDIWVGRQRFAVFQKRAGSKTLYLRRV